MKLGPDECTVVAPCAPWCPVPESNEAAAATPGWCCTSLDLDDETVRAAAVFAQDVASSVLFRLSHLRFNGCCEADEVLCVQRRSCGCWGWGWGSLPRPSGDGATWVNECCGRCSNCDCSTGQHRILLPYTPVTAVDTVTIGGVDVDGWQIVDGRWLYLPDAAAFSACFDGAAETATGLHVVWTHGQAPPPDGVLAACVLGCEIAKLCNRQPCDLPKRVTSASREGVSWTLLDPMDFLVNGRTGLYEVDLFLSSLGDSAPTTVTFPEDVGTIDFAERARARW